MATSLLTPRSHLREELVELNERLKELEQVKYTDPFAYERSGAYLSNVYSVIDQLTEKTHAYLRARGSLELLAKAVKKTPEEQEKFLSDWSEEQEKLISNCRKTTS